MISGARHLKAENVKSPEEYIHFSCRYYARGEADNLLTPSTAYLGLSDNIEERRRLYADYVKASRVQEEMMAKGLLAV